MCTQSQLNEIMKAMVECYRNVYANQIVDIVLYGSYARGDYTENSDIDIVVSPTVIPYDEFKKYQDTLPYYRNILQEGKFGWLNPLSAKK